MKIEELRKNNEKLNEDSNNHKYIIDQAKKTENNLRNIIEENNKNITEKDHSIKDISIK